jgi:hypothetical protein
MTTLVGNNPRHRCRAMPGQAAQTCPANRVLRSANAIVRRANRAMPNRPSDFPEPRDVVGAGLKVATRGRLLTGKALHCAGERNATWRS